MAKSKKLPPMHPCEILCEDFMKPLGISMNRLALDLRVPVTRISEIVHERRGITPDTALRLGRYFNTSPRFWMNAQSSYDLEVAQDELQATVKRDVLPFHTTPDGAAFISLFAPFHLGLATTSCPLSSEPFAV